MAVKQTAGRDALGEFAPKFAELNDEVLFGQVWSREDKLSLRDRSLVTVVALMAQGLTDSSFRYHLTAAKNNGITRTEIAEILTHAAFYVGWPKAWAAFRMAKEVWAEDAAEDAKASVLESLRKLRTDYLDLCLLHQPFADYYGAWHALEELYEAGKIRAIGVSNFYPDRLVDLCSFARIKPMVNQVEVHPLHQQGKAKEWMEKYGVQMEAWAPFGEGRSQMFTNPVLAEIGAKYGKTVAQVILRWHLQRGVVVIPKSTHRERMQENLEVFDFTLSSEDMERIAALDTKTSAFFAHDDPAMVEWFAQMVEQRKTNHDAAKEKKNR